MTGFEEQEYSKNFDLELWKKLIKYTIPYKKYIAALMALMVCVAAADAIYPLLTSTAIDNFIVPGKLDGMEIYIVSFFLLVVLQAVAIYFFILVAGKVEVGLTSDIRDHAFRRLQELSLSYYDRTPVGWMMARLTSDTQRLGSVIAWGLVDLIWGMTMMVFIVVVLFVLNWKLALIAMSVVPPLAVISVIFQRKILKAYRYVRRVNSRITGAFNEGIMGAKTSKTIVREEENLREFKELTNEMYVSSVKAAIYSATYMPIVLLLSSIGTSLIIWFGGGGVIRGVLTYGTLVAFSSYTVRFFEPIRDLARIFAELQYAQASGERIMSLIDTEPDVKDSPEIAGIYGDFFNPRPENWPPIKGNVVFENVTFAYKGGEKVLENFNLKVNQGERIALVGETGSGKSTIVNLMCRFYEPTEGRILIDGKDYRERSQIWLHSNLGYVLQSPHLFSGTIKDNIRYGKLDATDEEIIRAAKLVNAHDFIMKLEKGYDTDVGEGGNKLSTGQKQLISFARAVISNPAIFVLDEATSSIDTETEHAIQNAINAVLAGRTSFIIAHRLSTIKNADRILVLHNGKVVEEGTHTQLLKKKGRYYRLYTNQFKDEQARRAINV